LVHDAQDKQDVEIMDADEVSPAIVSLRLCENSKRDDDSEFLRARDRSNDLPWRRVVFTNYRDAIGLARWLRAHQQNSLPNSAYQFNYPSDTGKANVSLVPVTTAGNECEVEQSERTGAP
jgi:hypothetical protein